METQQDATRIGEVVQSSTLEFTAQCYRLNEPPPLGSLVKTHDGSVAIFGVVYNASTESIDPSRKPLALGEAEEKEEDIYSTHPQLQLLLRTYFQTLVLGHRDGDALRHYLSPRPARVHSFVHLCSKDELHQFTRSLRFIRVLVNSGAPTRDDATAAFLRKASAAHDDPGAFLVQSGKELAVLLADDMQRLNGLLRMLAG